MCVSVVWSWCFCVVWCVVCGVLCCVVWCAVVCCAVLCCVEEEEGVLGSTHGGVRARGRQKEKKQSKDSKNSLGKSKLKKKTSQLLHRRFTESNHLILLVKV